MRTNWKKLGLAALAIYVVGQIMGYLIHQVWLAPTYAALSSVWRPQAEMESKMWIFFVTAAIWAFFFCYVFAKGYEGKGLAEGARYGAIIGLFFGISNAYDQYVVYPIPYSLALKWFLSALAFCVVQGIVAAAVYKPARAA